RCPLQQLAEKPVLLLVGVLVVKHLDVQCLDECFPPLVHDMTREADYLTKEVTKLLDWNLEKVEIVNKCQRNVIRPDNHVLYFVPIPTLPRLGQSFDQNQ